GLFNPSQRISTQYESGAMRNALGFDWARDQTVIKHTAGSYNSAATVSGANQIGNSLTVTATSGTLKKGDIITLGTLGGARAVNAGNRVTKVSTGTLRQFAVTADMASGATSIPIYPAIVPGTAAYNSSTGDGANQYQTVTQSPPSGAAVTLVQKASETT